MTSESKQHSFGEKYLKYLNNLATFELVCGIIIGIYTFTFIGDINDLNSFSSYLRNICISTSIIIIVSSVIIYIVIIAIYHILDNSIENRKLLISLHNKIDKQEN